MVKLIKSQEIIKNTYSNNRVINIKVIKIKRNFKKGIINSSNVAANDLVKHNKFIVLGKTKAILQKPILNKRNLK